ncbi:MAG TPA: 1,4-alpha-glucan branching protein GlgB [Saprospiraceae bacterium]|nr:1,4-alpha-glucan branching protein GlgB [Saprospiraceae bacterium]
MKYVSRTYSLFTDFDIALFKSGKHFKLYEKMGAHLVEVNGEKGCYFAVWAPAARQVAVAGDFNQWTGKGCDLDVRWDGSGIWEGFIPGIKKGHLYKFKILSVEGQTLMKSDPYAIHSETPPNTAGVVWENRYLWKDNHWMETRHKNNSLEAPYSVYEVHLGSWKWNKSENRSLSYLELADELVTYVKEMGYTHVELMPVMEHPYAPSWGYQVSYYFAPTSRFGSPEEFAHLIDQFHQAGIGVILDWVPAHFPSDAWALAQYDGTCVYEHPDPRKGYHPDWKSLIFNYERNEVRSFLISSALYWLDRYHIDGLRVDAVASMIYLDYSRNHGEWEPNEFGGRENLRAISFLKEFNEAVYRHFPGTQTIAEESTAYPLITRPVDAGGLGFGIKWMMGWMNDTLDYFKKDPVYRKYHQGNLSFSIFYAFSENFMLPISHDEVVHGKASLLGKMPGDEWQRFANLRLLLGYMFTHPGSHLLFMGCDIGQYIEWNFKQGLDWHLLDFLPHKGVNALVKDLNDMYKSQKSLYEWAYDHRGFEWIDFQDADNSILVYLRKSKNFEETTLIICNFTPKVHPKYKIGLPDEFKWKLILNTDDNKYWGSQYPVKKSFTPGKKDYHGRKYSAEIAIAPLAMMVYKKIKTK